MKKTLSLILSLSLFAQSAMALPAVPTIMQSLPKEIQLDTDIPALLSLSPSNLPSLPDPPAEVLLASYVSAPTVTTSEFAGSRFAAQNAVYPSVEIHVHLENQECSSTSCGGAPGGVPESGIMVSPFNMGDFPRGGDSFPESFSNGDNSGGGSVSGGSGSATSSAMQEYGNAQSELSRANSDLSSAKGEYSSAQSAHSSSARELNGVLDQLNQASQSLNQAIAARNSAQSARNSAAHDANAANQALHNSQVHLQRIQQDIQSQRNEKAALEKRLPELEKQVNDQSTSLAAHIPETGSSEQKDTVGRENNKTSGNNGIDDHNLLAVKVNDSANLKEGQDAIKDGLAQANQNMASGNANSQLPTDSSAPGYVPPTDAAPGSVPAGIGANSGDRVASQCGSIIHVDTLALGESIPIVGTSIQLFYFSDRSRARLGDYQIHIPLKNSGVMDFSIAGRSGVQKVSGGSFDFVWDGKDQYGRLIVAKAPVRATLKIGNNQPSIEYQTFAGNFKPDFLGLGGWGVSQIHYYSIAESRVYFGTGNSRKSYARKQPNGNYLIPSEDGSSVYLFNSQGFHLETRHGLTGAVLSTIEYDPAMKVSAIVDAFGNRTAFNHSSGSVEIIGPYGQRTTLSMDSDARLANVRDANGGAYQMQYSGIGLLSSFTKPEGQTSRFVYDNLGYLQRDEGPAGKSLTFDGNWNAANPETVEMNMSTGEGRRSGFTVTQKPSGEYRRVTRDERGVSVITEYQPGSFERRTSPEAIVESKYSTDARFGADVNFPAETRVSIPGSPIAPNETKVEQFVSRSANQINGGFADFGRLTNVIESFRGKTTYDYFQSNRQMVTTSPMGRRTYFTIDSIGRPVSLRRTNLSPMTLYYDERGRLQTSINGNRRSDFKYNSAGLVERLSDSLGRTHKYAYDGLGQLLSDTRPDGGMVQYRYDRNGNLISLTPPGRPEYLFHFNVADLIESEIPPAIRAVPNETIYRYNRDKQMSSVQLPGGESLSFAYYDSSTLLRSVTTPSGPYVFGYDSAARLNRAVSPEGVTTNFDYYGSLPKLQSTILPSGTQGTVSFAYNPDQSVAAEAVYSDQTTFQISYQYDRDGLLTSAGDESLELNGQTGGLEKIRLGHIIEAYRFDPIYGEFVSVQAAVSEKNVIYSESVARDQLGRITARRESYGMRPTLYTYAYDSSGRLATVFKNKQLFSQYTYDANGNRNGGMVGGQSINAQNDAQDRLIFYNGNSYAFGPNGDLRTKTNVVSRQSNSYHYDIFANLKQVQLTNRPIIEYVTDALNRRIAKKLDGKILEQYIYQNQLQIAAVLDGSGNVVSRFIYGSKTNSPDYMIRDGRTYKMITDHLGSPRAIVDADSGDVAQRMKFDEFGRVLADSNPGFQPFGFAGGLYDRDTGFVRLGARDFDPEIGRWTTKDPAGFGGGDTNLYGYVMNDPINLRDENGREPVTLTAIGIGAAVGAVFGGASAYAAGARDWKTIAEASAVGAGAGAVSVLAGVAWAGYAAGFAINSFLGGATNVGIHYIAEPDKPLNPTSVAVSMFAGGFGGLLGVAAGNSAYMGAKVIGAAPGVLNAIRAEQIYGAAAAGAAAGITDYIGQKSCQ
jgi:RHS repeat-associated protein